MEVDLIDDCDITLRAVEGGGGASFTLASSDSLLVFTTHLTVAQASTSTRAGVGVASHDHRLRVEDSATGIGVRVEVSEWD